MTDAEDGHLVVFTPSGRRGHVAEGTTVLDAARRLGVDLDSVCGDCATWIRAHRDPDAPVRPRRGGRRSRT